MPFDVWAEPHLLGQGDAYSQIQSLATKLVTDQGKQDARREHVRLVHGQVQKDHRTVQEVHGSYNEMIRLELARMQALGLVTPAPPDNTLLQRGFTFVQFRFTLAKPYLSKDDEALHICDNPLRKDKVFKVPLLAATAWKGLLRWAAVKLVVEASNKWSDEEFVRRRLQVTRLFGNEKEVELDEAAQLMSYLDDQHPAAATLYRHELKRLTSTGFVAGRLQFYPTFFDRMDVEVINPHDRQTKAGTHPIYFESVPIGARGTFSLLYAPLDWAGGRPGAWKSELTADMSLLGSALSTLFLRYGFSAKRSSGFGVARNEIDGQVWAYGGTTPLTQLAKLREVMKRAVAY